MSSPPPIHPTAELLLQAGTALADQRGLATMTVDAVVERAGTGKGTFYRHFSDQSAFLIALQARFASGVATAVADAASGAPPGAARLRFTLNAYLDACLGQRGLKTFLTEARNVPEIQIAVDDALESFAKLIAVDLRTLKLPNAQASARLIVAMAHEVAIAEQVAGRRHPALREALLELSGAG
jgi:TetR/AcrR family transcriptional repressor of nem operon